MNFDFSRAIQRIHEAQQKMNLVPTSEGTNYWVRIWRARRRSFCIATKNRISLMPA
jgi:hypothetical protein